MKLCPSEIVRLKYFYSIPIYQRLFEWDTDNVLTLLDDLKKSFVSSNSQEDYYIGMLTSTDNNELVDGQQRFTVLMLMGCVFQDYDENWKHFLLLDERTRLHFSSRPSDEAYMRSLIEKIPAGSQNFANKKMQNGVNLIRAYVEDDKVIPVQKRSEFASYIFRHLCFFVTNLPKGYSPRDLNKYFERMNTSGRDLEQHEILKVKLLSNLKQDVDKYMSLWNKLADVDTLLIRKHNNENEDDLAQRKQRAFQLDIDEIFTSDVINGLGVNDDGDEQSIVSVAPSSNQPKAERETNQDSRCALTFPYSLLQSLYRLLEGKIDSRIDDFFKPSNLLDTFAKYLPYDGTHTNEDDIKSFMRILFRGRLALDICFVRPSEFGYILDMNLREGTPELKNLMMLQSMLLVSSSNYTNYRWFGWLMDAIENGIPDAAKMFAYLKSRDNEVNRLPEYDKLSFGSEMRYWFWKLDFYIWQHRKSIFKDSPKALAVAENYVFRRNRSIEHIAPQTPQSNSMMIWGDNPEDAKLRDSFGNLVMISQGLNSALSNESYEVKAAHVQSYCNEAKSGSIESLKLLIVHQECKVWNKETIREHGEKMYNLLRKSVAD